MRAALRLAVAIVVLFAVAGNTAAGPPGQWTRLPGTVENSAEPGLARTADGVLHVVYVQENGPRRDLVHVAITPAGRVEADAVALGGWRSMNHPDLIRMPNGSLRVFFGGIRSTAPGETNTALNTATAPASGARWTLQIGKAAQSDSAYAGATTGAGLARDGTPISAWYSTAGMGFHYGTSSSDADRAVPRRGCCLYAPEIAVDATTGQAYIGFFSLENGAKGLYAHEIAPAGVHGQRWTAPGVRVRNNALNPGGRTALTGRIGADGVFMAHGQGFPTYKAIAVSRVGAAEPQIVVKADRAEHVNVAAAPEGRLWVIWEQSGTIVATRTNKAVTTVGPVTKLKPQGAVLSRLGGEGSAGPLDLVANVRSAGQALWHEQILPRLQLTGERLGRSIVFRVADADDPVAGAQVKVRGKTLTTGTTGVARLNNAPAGRVGASASKPGYTIARTVIR